MTFGRLFIAGYDFEESSWFINFKLPEVIKMGGIYFITPPLFAVACIALVMSTVIARKTCKPLIISGISITVLEAVSFIEFLIYMIKASIISAVIFIYAFMFFAATTLLIVTYMSIKRKCKDCVVYITAGIIAIAFLRLFINQTTNYSSIINMMLLAYSFSEFIMFVLFNLYYKKCILTVEKMLYINCD